MKYWIIKGWGPAERHWLMQIGEVKGHGIPKRSKLGWFSLKKTLCIGNFSIPKIVFSLGVERIIPPMLLVSEWKIHNCPFQTAVRGFRCFFASRWNIMRSVLISERPLFRLLLPSLPWRILPILWNKTHSWKHVLTIQKKYWRSEWKIMLAWMSPRTQHPIF